MIQLYKQNFDFSWAVQSSKREGGIFVRLPPIGLSVFLCIYFSRFASDGHEIVAVRNKLFASKETTSLCVCEIENPCSMGAALYEPYRREAR